MGENLPDAGYVPPVDRRRGGGLEQGQGRYDAAVCARAARLHGLEVLADGIRDMQAAVTRFVLVARPGGLPAHGRGQDHRGALPA